MKVFYRLGLTFLFSFQSVMETLPIDILSSITNYCTVYDIVHLFLTGSKELNLKLANGGVLKFELNWNGSRYLTWPSIISRLKLQSLSISDIEDTNNLSVNLASLSPTLHHLQFDFRNSLSCLLPTGDDDSTHPFPFKDKL